MNDVMLDLETMGNDPNAAIVSIGAVKFNEEGLGEEFYEIISLEDSVKNGGTITVSTIEWWIRQDKAASKEWLEKGGSLRDALHGFSDWLGHSNYRIWGNGASFDNVILASAYRNTGIEQPWKFWNDMCYRTIKNRYPNVPFERVGTHHNALDDAKSQAMHLIQINKQEN